MANTNWDLITEFTRKYWPVTNRSLTRSTRLYEDLGIKGDDADSFIYEFSKAFNVNTDNLNLSNYFGRYNNGILFSFMKLFKSESNEIPQKQRTLTLGDLEDALAVGKLDDNMIIDQDIN